MFVSEESMRRKEILDDFFLLRCDPKYFGNECEINYEAILVEQDSKNGKDLASIDNDHQHLCSL